MTTATDSIPLVDLRYQYDVVRDAVDAAIRATLDATAYIGGTAVQDFERSFAQYCGVTDCVGVANGTDAIELALRAVGIGHGDRVALPTNTFVATAEAVVRAGAEPVLVDCDPEHLLMSPAHLANVVRRHAPRAVVPVHLYGQIAPMPEILDVANTYGCVVIEDAAQAQGALHRNVGMGGWGLIAATSFYPGKNLGAFGDAGAVTTCNPDLAARVRLLANHGSSVRYRHDIVGMNSRLDTIQANVLNEKLRYLDAWNHMRATAAAFYTRALRGAEQVRTPLVAPGNEHVWHLYVIQVDDRDRILASLQREGIGAAVHYPIPLHLQPAFASLGHRVGDFPNAEAATARILSLPIFPGITTDQQSRVVDAVLRTVR